MDAAVAPLPCGITAEVLFRAISFGLGHGREVDTFLTTRFLYGLPMAVAFVKRDW